MLRIERFQFLNGTIITHYELCEYCSKSVSIPQWYDYYLRFATAQALQPSFNSSMVRLLPPTPPPTQATSAVSIPQWYDYYNRFILFAHVPYQVSIPQWYDYYLHQSGIETYLKMFQFLNGTIITYADMIVLATHICFNSSMVRLLLAALL